MAANEVTFKRNGLERARLDIDRGQLQVNQERLAHDKQKDAEDRRFLKRNSGVIMTALVSLVVASIGAGISAAQWWLANKQAAEAQTRTTAEFALRKDADNASERERKNRWKLDIAKFIIEHREKIYSVKATERENMIALIKAAFPEEQAEFALRSISSSLPEDKQKEFKQAAKVVAQIPREVIKSASEYLASQSEGIQFGGGAYGDVVLNGYPQNVSKANKATYIFDLPGVHQYDVWIEYAAADPRPVKISFNDKVVAEKGLSTATGGWFPQNQQFQLQARVVSKAGQNLLQLYRGDVFPHIRRLKLVPVSGS
ncbi:MAG: hypothetical protein HY322_16815 [Betaproteobacteria bacterium]|nr:hypothetical protein [Betaproteobacteria bacterium]